MMVRPNLELDWWVLNTQYFEDFLQVFVRLISQGKRIYNFLEQTLELNLVIKMKNFFQYQQSHVEEKLTRLHQKH
ncbi:hypothetical protein YC2023_119355 [Brassica napus]